MSALQAGTESPPRPAPAIPLGVGASLRSARERAGLSVDQVAQQLKLAPRQVKALEDEDFAQLPGRTFARGFVRNYARLLDLDGDGLLAQLPDAAHAPALAAPALHSTSGSMAEVPTTRAVRPVFGRWLIPLLLVACIVAAGAYEWYRSGWAVPGEGRRAPVVPSAAGPTAPPGTARSELANPLASAPAEETPGGERVDNAAPVSPAPEPQTAALPPAAAASVAAEPSAASTPAPAAESTPTAGEAPAPLVLSYRAASWTQVRDGKGQLVFVRVVPAGSEQAIRGTPPFDVTIGNARAVTLVYRGQPIDLTRYTHQNVARVRLP
ncbi:MAG TPA: RodZ domain-containing protein [Casimicrobiaceae bacterium]|nr:RodZ domain-containing protein [Casimicrobiaceae bacterium]